MPESMPALSPMVEDYLTLIWKAYEWPGGAPSTTEMAAKLGVTASTVSANLKKLARDGYIDYEPYGAIELTELGRQIAIPLVRRHRIIETYLVEQLGLGWDEVHVEADRLEHAVSEVVLAAMDASLGHPTHDPHGDPIPTPSGEIVEVTASRLTEAAVGAHVQVLRVSDRHPEVLQYLAAKGVGIGVELVVELVVATAGVVRVRRGDAEVELPAAVASEIRVAPLG